MKEFELKYGCNPNQKPARIYMKDGSELPVTVLNGHRAQRPPRLHQLPRCAELLAACQRTQ